MRGLEINVEVLRVTQINPTAQRHDLQNGSPVFSDSYHRITTIIIIQILIKKILYIFIIIEKKNSCFFV